MIDEKIYDNGKVQLNYVVLGKGNIPILFLHGGFSSWKSVRVFNHHLLETYKIYAYDSRGYGKSSKPASDYNLITVAQDAKDFIEQVIGQPAFVFGSSYGGFIATTLSAIAPDLVTGLMLGESPIFVKELMTNPAMLSAFSRWKKTAQSKKSPLALVQETADLAGANKIIDSYQLFGILSSIKKLDPGLLLTSETLSYLDGYEVEDFLARITCPILMIGGKNGGLINQDYADRVKKFVKHE